MREQTRFRPVGGECLETRAVPTGGLNGFLGNIIGSVPQQDARLVERDFQNFVQTYAKDVQTILLAPGTTNPANNRTAFDTAIGMALNDLNAAIDKDIANLSTASTLDTTIQGQLLGSDSTALQSQLMMISSPTGTKNKDLRPFLLQAVRDIGRTENTVLHEVRTAPAANGAISLATVQQDLKAINTAFQTFFQTYNNDINTILLPSGTTDPASNRVAFDAAVATALGTLNTSIASALSNLPASVASSLTTQIQNDLLTNTSSTGTDTSLQGRLKDIASPTSTTGFSPFLFRLQSGFNILITEGQVFGQFLTAVRNFNSSLGGSTMT